MVLPAVGYLILEEVFPLFKDQLHRKMLYPQRATRPAQFRGVVRRPDRQKHAIRSDHAQLHILDPLVPLLKNPLIGQFPHNLHIILLVMHDMAIDTHPLVVLILDHILIYGFSGAHSVSIVNLTIIEV